MLSLLPHVLWLLQASSEERIREAVSRLEAGHPSTQEETWETLASSGEAGAAILTRLRGGAAPRLRDYLDLALAEIRFRGQLPGQAALRRVSYACKDKPLVEVLAELEPLLQFPVLAEGAEPDPAATVSLSVKQAPVMDLLFLLAQACLCGLRIEGDRVILDPEESVAGFVSGWNGWRIRLAGFEWFKKWDFRGPREDLIHLALQVSGVPSPQVARVHPLVFQELRDAKGKDLLFAEEAPAPGRVDFPLEPEQRRMLPFSGGTRTLRCLRGHLPVDYSRREIRIVLPNPEKGASVTEGGIRLSIGHFDPEEQHLQASVRLPESMGPARYALPVRARLVFPPGVRARVEVSPQAEDERLDFGISWAPLGGGNGNLAPKNLKPERLSITVVTEVVQRKIPFEFRDLELK